MEKDKLLSIVFITHYTEMFGANKSLIGLMEELSAWNNVKLLLIVPGKGKITERAERKNIRYSVIPFYNEISYDNNDPKWFFWKNGLKHIINLWLTFRHARKLHHFDIIHTNSSATLIGAYLARRLAKPHVWHIREFGFEDYRFKYNFGYSYFNKLMNRAAAIISISQAIFNKRVTDSKVNITPIIYNGIISTESLELNRKHYEERRGKKTGKITFAIVGVLAKGKKQLEAIQAFHLLYRDYPDSRLLIVGSGDDLEYEQELMAYVADHQLQASVLFLGYITDMGVVYKQIDCLLMCSENEAFGRVTVEAMSFGVVVIGYNNGGTSEIIQNGHNGIVYENGYKGLHKKMEFFVKNMDSLESLRKNAMESCLKYTTENYVNAVYEVYEAVLKNIKRIS